MSDIHDANKASETSGFVKEARRKKTMIHNTLYTMVGYAIPIISMIIAKAMGFASYPFQNLLILSLSAYGLTLVILYTLYVKEVKEYNVHFINQITLLQFCVWIGIYFFMVLFLNEIRLSALFFALIAFVFLLSSSDFKKSFILSILFIPVQINLMCLLWQKKDKRKYLTWISGINLDSGSGFFFWHRVKCPHTGYVTSTLILNGHETVNQDRT